MEIREGQIWREVDNRFDRFVRVVSTRSYIAGQHRILVRTVEKTEGGKWRDKPKGLTGNANAARFDGKHGGYSFVATL